MKHYARLTDIENVSIDLDVLSSTVRVLTYGMPEAHKMDIERSMHNITEQIDLISHRLNHAFNELFDEIREESKDEAKGRKSKPGKDKV